MRIKYCPFCGGEAIVVKERGEIPCDDQYQVLCPYVEGENKGCGSASGYHSTMKEAIDAWNKRVKTITPCDECDSAIKTPSGEWECGIHRGSLIVSNERVRYDYTPAACPKRAMV